MLSGRPWLAGIDGLEFLGLSVLMRSWRRSASDSPVGTLRGGEKHVGLGARRAGFKTASEKAGYRTLLVV